ncbi:MAG TPA: glycosyl hydrolase family 28 protein, partial [Verrucomicrobiae bacterium]
MKIKNTSALLCVALFVGWAPFIHAQTPVLPVIPSGTYYVTNYGALGNGTKDDTTNIQNAINAASTAGVGTVEITPGTFESGPLTFAKSLNLQIDSGAMLQMLPLSRYPGGDTSPSTFLTGSGLTDIELSGAGTIDGQGVAWWNDEATNGGTAPEMIIFSRCKRVLIQNLTFSNSPIQFIGIKNTCGNVTIQNITITAPGDSPNTDGIDVEATNMLISGCSIGNGDDCVAILGGSSVSAASSSILITNCALSNGHGISLGSSIVGGISNLTVISCTFSNTQYGIRLKSNRTEGGLAQNLSFLNLQMTNVYTGIPFLLFSYYDIYSTSKASPTLAAADPAQSVTSLTPIWQNLTFSNITSVSTVASGAPILIWGLPEMLVSNVTFNDVNITGAASCGIYNASDIQFINSTITVPGGSNTFKLYDAQLTLSNSAPASQLVTIDGLTTNSIGNTLAFYNAPAGLYTTNVIEPPQGPLALGGSTTLTVSNSFKMVSGTVLDYLLGTNTTKAAVIGNLTLGGTINVAGDAGFGLGTNTLLTYTGSLSGSLPTLGSMPANYTGSLKTTTAGLVQLVVQTNSGGGL